LAMATPLQRQPRHQIRAGPHSAPAAGGAAEWDPKGHEKGVRVAGRGLTGPLDLARLRQENGIGPSPRAIQDTVSPCGARVWDRHLRSQYLPGSCRSPRSLGSVSWTGEVPGRVRLCGARDRRHLDCRMDASLLTGPPRCQRRRRLRRSFI